MIIVSLIEVLSIGTVLPFIGALTAPNYIFEHPRLQSIIHVFGISTPSELLLPLTTGLISLALLGGAARVALSWISARVSNMAGSDLAIDIFRRTLSQPYAVHIARNSNQIVDGVTVKAHAVTSLFVNAVILSGSVVTLSAIVFALIIINAKIALTLLSGFGLIYLSIVWFSRRRLSAASAMIANGSVAELRILQEALGGIRDVLISGTQQTYCRLLAKLIYRVRTQQVQVAVIASSPRFVIEALGIALIAAVAYFLASEPNGLTRALPVLGTLVVGMQRLLPNLQQIYTTWTGILSQQASVENALALLEQPLPVDAVDSDISPLPFRDQIFLRNVCFRYSPSLPYVLENIELRIPLGARFGFIGTTGGGKSTLLDVVMGLLSPTSGSVEIDGVALTECNMRRWQIQLAHVPQSIYLSDASIEENIAFGIPLGEIDGDRVRRAAQQAQIGDTIESWPDGYKTNVGERGVRLSGGQRQRIGIARALYKAANVIVFDEATSALDNETEKAVMDAIDALSHDVTILVVAHRLTTLRGCDRIVELDRGKISRIGTYSDLIDMPEEKEHK